MKDEHTYGKKVARKGSTEVTYKRTFISKQSLCFFTFSKSLACLALQTETIIAQTKLPKTKNEITKICNEPGKRIEHHLH